MIHTELTRVAAWNINVVTPVSNDIRQLTLFDWVQTFKRATFFFVHLQIDTFVSLVGNSSTLVNYRLPRLISCFNFSPFFCRPIPKISFFQPISRLKRRTNHLILTPLQFRFRYGSLMAPASRLVIFIACPGRDGQVYEYNAIKCTISKPRQGVDSLLPLGGCNCFVAVFSLDGVHSTAGWNVNVLSQRSRCTSSTYSAAQTARPGIAASSPAAYGPKLRRNLFISYLVLRRRSRSQRHSVVYLGFSSFSNEVCN